MDGTVANTRLQFDDIDLSKTANRTLDSHRFLKDFQNFQVMNTTAANHSGILAPEDMNCAASKPNALRNIPGPYSPNSFFGSDAKALNAMNVSEYFDVMSFTAKPIGPVDAYTLITVNAWELDGKDGKNLFSVYIWYGDEEKFAEPLQLDMQEIFPGWGVKVNWLEFAAETEYGDPWDFCLDNVVLRFHKEGDEDEEIYHVL